MKFLRERVHYFFEVFQEPLAKSLDFKHKLLIEDLLDIEKTNRRAFDLRFAPSCFVGPWRGLNVTPCYGAWFLGRNQTPK